MTVFMKFGAIRNFLFSLVFFGGTLFADVFDDTVFRLTFTNDPTAGVQLHNISYVGVTNMPNGNGIAASFNGTNSQIECDISQLPELVTNTNFTYHIRLRLDDFAGEYFLMGRYGVGFLQSVENWAQGLVGAGGIGYCAEERLVPGRFYDIFVRFRAKVPSGANGVIFTHVFDTETGQELTHSRSWSTGYTGTDNMTARFMIGFEKGYDPLKGEVEQLNVWNRYLSEANMDFVVNNGRTVIETNIPSPLGGKVAVIPKLRNTEASNRWNAWIQGWTNFPTCAWAYFHHYIGSVSEYQTYKDAGLTMVMASRDNSANAESVGLRTFTGLWNPNGRYAELYNNPADLDSYINCGKSTLPSRAGYLLADEPKSRTKLAAFSQAFETIYQDDPKALPIVDLLSYSFSVGEGFSRALEFYIKANHPAVLLTDAYVLFKSWTWTDKFYANYERVRRRALQADIGFMGFVLNTGHGPFRTASESDLYWQANSLVAYGAKGIWYYNYRIGGDLYNEGLVTDSDGAPTTNYYYVKTLNSKLHSVGSVLMNLKTEGIWHVHRTSAEKPSLTTLYHNGVIAGIETLAGDDLLVGAFKGINALATDRSTYVVIVNKRHDGKKRVADSSLQTTFSIKVNDAYVLYKYDLEDGSAGILTGVNGGHNFSLGGGELVLLRLVPPTS